MSMTVEKSVAVTQYTNQQGSGCISIYEMGSPSCLFRCAGLLTIRKTGPTPSCYRNFHFQWAGDNAVRPDGEEKDLAPVECQAVRPVQVPALADGPRIKDDEDLEEPLDFEEESDARNLRAPVMPTQQRQRDCCR